MIHIYATTHRRNRIIADAFNTGIRSQGGKAKIVPPGPLLPGDVFVYGALRGTLQPLRQAMAEGRTWYYGDNGYFLQGYKDAIHRGYFRITRNALQHDGSGKAGPDRWRQLKLEIKPWRQSGSHVLVCPPDQRLAELWEFDHEAWLEDALFRLRAATDRPIHVRLRETRTDASQPLSAALADCWAMVTRHSNAATEALLAGIPVFCTHPCASARMARSNLSLIEDPWLPDDREQWAWNLAANQWTIAEIRSGLAWRMLQCTA